VTRSRDNALSSKWFATHLLEDGYEIRSVQEFLAPRQVKTTMIYTHVIRQGFSIRSPVDVL